MRNIPSVWSGLPSTIVLGLVAVSKLTNAQAELAIAEAVTLDEQEGPKREAERQKKQTDDLEVARRRTRKVFVRSFGPGPRK